MPLLLSIGIAIYQSMWNVAWIKGKKGEINMAFVYFGECIHMVGVGKREEMQSHLIPLYLIVPCLPCFLWLGSFASLQLYCYSRYCV